MDKNAEVLARILEEMTGGMADSRKIRQIAEKTAQGTATYADALEFARESGRIMTGSMRKNIPEVLTDGKLYREAADQVVRKPLQRSGKQVAQAAADIQQRLNEEADIGINAIVPELNDDQITGIITDICNADSYESGAEKLFTQVENFLEGTVDDCVRENASFQYQAGLSPKIERRAVGKCCAWCSRLAGTYEYADVSDKGNDVFRRHKNCHCIVSYIPANGAKRRQNVHSKRWTEDTDSAILKQRQVMNLDIQQFAHKTGEYRATMYSSGWQRASLKEAIKKFTPNATITENKAKWKVMYDGEDGRYQILYDRKGNYFRIMDKSSKSRNRPFVGLDGESLLNKTENGRTVGRSKPEYEQVSHFYNTD